jgi:hypothetical protein
MLCLLCSRETHDRVCDSCRARLYHQLDELPDLLAEALTLTLAGPLRWRYEYVGAHLGCANRITVVDTATLPAGPTGSPGRVRVSGSREDPTPVSVELLNLIGPGSVAVSDPHRDQVGELPPAVWAATVAEDWAEQLGHTPPVGHLSALVAWLTDRLPWACDHIPDLEEFATELRQQHGALRHAAEQVEPRAEFCDGVDCPGCDARALWRQPGSGRVYCGLCPRVMTQDEYQAWMEGILKSSA